ncbi:GNAT family N-acetyltransferase [Streptomyces boncukensis]|uniref:GNAT family N-acetyltransferase n=1 Tax=Streptomyces boncukensis TaxID=2711219 RepID=A0A6G4WST6_9ACTN|nr:GNAT family N-acetyltransferase [Streptomyces boncukensis]NGO68265.1 GNAT family N-acetyltransferase [Streptomyces boncukensis]
MSTPPADGRSGQPASGPLTIRALTDADARAVFTSLADPGLVGRPLLGRPYATLREGGEYRPEWTFVAERAGAVVARAAFFGAPDDAAPVVLDWFDLAPGEHAAGAELLRAAPFRVEFELVLPPGWQDQPRVRAAAEARIAAAADAGYVPLVERYRYEWAPERGLPRRHPGRLAFRSARDDEEVLDVLRRVMTGTLDAHALRAIEEGGVEQAAREDLAHLQWMTSPRAWWQVAHTPDGELAGLHVPGRIPSGHAAAFIGVVPEQRGHGYAYDLLAECTHLLAAEGAERIAASTDTGNAPMAAAFARAGYPVVQHRYCMTPPG